MDKSRRATRRPGLPWRGCSTVRKCAGKPKSVCGSKKVASIPLRSKPKWTADSKTLKDCADKKAGEPLTGQRGPPGRLNKFAGPNLLTLDIDRRRRAEAQKPRRRSSRVPLGPCAMTQTQLQRHLAAGNRCFGATTPSVSPLRVTVTFGARRSVVPNGLACHLVSLINWSEIS